MLRFPRFHVRIVTVYRQNLNALWHQPVQGVQVFFALAFLTGKTGFALRALTNCWPQKQALNKQIK